MPNTVKTSRRSLFWFILMGVFLFSGATKMTAKEPDLQLIRPAVEFIRSGKLDQAEALANETLRQKQSSAEAFVILAKCSVWRDDPSQAIEYLTKAVKASKENAPHAYAHISSLLFPELYLQEDLDEESVNYAKFYLSQMYDKYKADPQDIDVLFWRGDMIENMQIDRDRDRQTKPENLRYDFAICDATMAILLASKSDLAGMYRNRAHLWEMRANNDPYDIACYQKSADDLRRVVEYSNDPEDDKPKLAEALVKAGKIQEALDLVPKKMDGLSEFTVETWLRVESDCLIKLQKFKEAIDVLSRLIERLERKTDSERLGFRLLDRAECYFELGEYEAAIADLDRSLESLANKERGGYRWTWKYRVMLRLGKWDEIQAAIDHEKGLSNYPNNARFERAKYYVELERWEEAEKDLLIVAEEGYETNYEPHRNLATVYEKLGKPDLAKKHAARAQEIYDSLEPWDR